MDLELRGTGNSRAFLQGLRAAPPETPWRARIDLQWLEWCQPVVLVGIACLVESEIRQGREVVVAGPLNPEVSTYLARMRLGHVLTSLGADHDLPTVHEREADSLLELRLFNGSRGAEQLARLLQHELTGVDHRVGDALAEGICETGQNVEQHSAQQFGFVAAQLYHSSAEPGRRRFVFAVGDSGRGLLATLAGVGATTHQQAVALAAEPGTTETGDPARGTGLSDILSYLHDLDGGLDLVSGDAGRRDHARNTYGWRSQQRFQGTLVQGELCR